ncbi:2-acylglycerol O-acyltransferase 2 [Angomonas deanei]|nr:2-acylglycerol O-acyltransferase 2 [Angomonas deanei]|eukprot:EPY36977.1 2-acylglycerol O-acyltransferase 2 [Angomonas deanei]
MILYIVFIFTLGRPKHPMRKKMFNVRLPIFKYYRDYFPIRLVVPPSTREKFDKQKNYLFAYHPHGVHTFGAILCFGTEANFASKMLPGIKTHLQTLKVNYFIPFWRWCMVGMGAGDASADCIRKTLRAGPGESVVLVVGGAEESLMSKPNSNDIVLQKRKGFIKIALQEGASLVPVYGFGENNAYNISTLAENRRMKYFLRVLKKYTGFTVPLISGRGFFLKYGVPPHRRPIVVVVGDPLDLPRIPHPTPEELDHWQQAYITALQKLYNQHRDLYDLESTGLRIIK